jgi:hypothetical protein
VVRTVGPAIPPGGKPHNTLRFPSWKACYGRQIITVSRAQGFSILRSGPGDQFAHGSFSQKRRPQKPVKPYKGQISTKAHP